MRISLVVAAALLFALSASGQTSVNMHALDKAKDYSHLTIRVGSLLPAIGTLSVPANARPSLGVGVNAYLGRTGWLHRLSPNVQLDLVPLADEKMFDTILDTDVFIATTLTVFQFGMGFDLVQRSQFDLTLYGGAAVNRETSGVSVPNSNPVSRESPRTIKLCSELRFDDSCWVRYDLMSAGGVGFRIYPVKGKRYFLGVDTRFFDNGSKYIAGTVGLSF